MSALLEDWEKVRLEYTDAELYRIVVARTIADGNVPCKADFDAQVRQIGDLEECDKIIAFTDQRPGCIASEDCDRFICPCGNQWNADDADQPVCKEMP
jgi:hypothetical protein